MAVCELVGKMTEELDKEVSDMCNLSKGIEERGIRIGMQQAILNSIQNLMETMNLASDKAMDALKIPSEDRGEYRRLLENK